MYTPPPPLSRRRHAGKSAGPNAVRWIKGGLKSLFIKAKTRKRTHARRFSGAGRACLVAERTAALAARRWSRLSYRTHPHKWRLC